MPAEATDGERAEARRSPDEELVEDLLRGYVSLKRRLGDLLPPEFWQHGRRSQKEALLALRSLLDRAIERAEREEAQSTRQEIPIE